MWKGLSLKRKYKEAWLEALRSGKYKQGQGALVARDHNKQMENCCLGVFGIICGAKVVDGVEKSFDLEVFYNRKPHTQGDLLPNIWFAKFFNFNKKYASPGVGDSTHKESVVALLQSHLAAMNDEGQPFGQIAKWIEDNL